MLKILSLLLALAPSPASAQQANMNYLGLQSSTTVATGNNGLASTTGIAATFTNIAIISCKINSIAFINCL